MLTESFAAATLNAERNNATAAGVHLYEYQPLCKSVGVLKKSSARANCLAISQSHVFVAQEDKAVVQVYNRERKNLETTVPFPEKITSIALAGESKGVAGVLVLGTVEGRIILWEILSGRQVSSAQQHLKAVECVAVDPTSSLLLSGGTDSNIHVWSLTALLSFISPSDDAFGNPAPPFPIRSLSRHRDGVVSFVFGHSHSKINIAVSLSKDKTCIVWDYHLGLALQTFLLAASPLSLAIDPVDRAVYVGHDDGSVSIVDLYRHSQRSNPLHGSSEERSAIQLSASERCQIPQDISSPALCATVVYDGTAVLTGHENGKIHSWDVARTKYRQQVADLGAPVTCLTALPLEGFLRRDAPSLRVHSVVKPTYEKFAKPTSSMGRMPENYSLTAEFRTSIDVDDEGVDVLDEALTHPVFPRHLLDATIAALADGDTEETSQPVNGRTDAAGSGSLLERLHSTQQRLELLEKKDRQRQRDDLVKAHRKRKRRLRQSKIDERTRKAAMGEEAADDTIMLEDDQGACLSSDTEELAEGE